MNWIAGQQVKLLRRMAIEADRLAEAADEAARSVGHGALWRSARELPRLVRSSLLVIDAIELRLAALDAGELGWFVAANAVLQTSFVRMAGALRWSGPLSDDAHLIALLFALRSPPTRAALEEVAAEVMRATRPDARRRALEELLTGEVLADAGGVLSWGAMAPKLPPC